MLVFDSNRAQSVKTNLLLCTHTRTFVIVVMLLLFCFDVTLCPPPPPKIHCFMLFHCSLLESRLCHAMRMPCWLLSRVNILKSKRKSIVQSHTHATKVVISSIFCYPKLRSGSNLFDCFVNFFLFLFWSIYFLC